LGAFTFLFPTSTGFQWGGFPSEKIKSPANFTHSSVQNKMMKKNKKMKACNFQTEANIDHLIFVQPLRTQYLKSSRMDKTDVQKQGAENPNLCGGRIDKCKSF